MRQHQRGLNDHEIDIVTGLSRQERNRRTSVGFGDQNDLSTFNTPDLSGRGWEYFDLRSRGPHEQDPGNQEKYGRMLNRNELQVRIVCVKGLDANCTPGEVLDLFKRGGVVTALTIIKGIIENYWGVGRNQWTGRNLAYVEYSQPGMLDGPVPGVSTCGALSLHKKRFLNRVCEVYRSNLESKGSWDDDEDEGHLG